MNPVIQLSDGGAASEGSCLGASSVAAALGPFPAFHHLSSPLIAHLPGSLGEDPWTRSWIARKSRSFAFERT